MAKNISRRSFLRAALVSTTVLGTGGAGGLLYSSRVEPWALDITRVTLRLPHLPTAFNGYTIAQVSDLHLGEWMTYDRMAWIAERVNALAPDVIAFTGDFVSAQPPGVYAQVTRSLRAFHARDAIFGTFGNHDYWTNPKAARDAIAQAENVTMLLNDQAVIKRSTDALWFAGVDDIWEQQHDLTRALNGIPANAPLVLLAHEPDYADEVAADGRVGLQLSGHSHGGQVRIPGRGAIALPTLGQKYDAGLYSIGGMSLYTNRGVGMVAPYVRFNCPPEVTLFTLQT